MQSLYLFCRDTLGYKDLLTKEDEQEPDYSHEELCHYLQFDKNPFKLILMPRYSFKSTLATVGRTLWKLVDDPNLRVLIYSDAATKAEGFLTSIKNHLTGLDKNSQFRAIYGTWETDSKKGTWNQSAIVIQPRAHAHKEPSVDTGGIETSKVGMHYDIIIFDDIVSDKNVTTPDQIQKVKECYQKSLSLLKPGGEVIMVGTRWDFSDLYGSLLAREEEHKKAGFPPVFSTFITRAEINDKYPWENIGLTKDFLTKQRTEQGSYVYSCLYQNSPVDESTAIFKASDFTFYQPSPNIARELYVTCCLDPAISQAKASDDTALTVVGTDNKLNMYILDIIAGRMLPDETVAELFRLHSKWRINAFGVETNNFQKMLKTDIDLTYEQERTNNPLFRMFTIAEFTGTSTNTKAMRIRSLQPYHERGALLFPGTRQELLTGSYHKLSMQMLQFPRTTHDDILDSLAYHVLLHRKGNAAIKQQEIPIYSAAWIMEENRKKQEEHRNGLPRWRRDLEPILQI